MSERFDFAIVGAGSAGLSTAWALSERTRARVVVLEREDTSARHSSGLNAAILRTIIDEPEVAALAERSVAFFDAPPAGFTDGPLVRRTGLVLTADREDAAARLEASVARSTRPIEALDPERLRELAPHVATDARAAFLAPDDGVLDIHALTAGFERAAREQGVELRYGTGVASLWFDGAQRVQGLELANGERVEAACVVIAAGGWATELVRGSASRVELEPRRRHLLVTAADDAVDPDWPVVWNAGESYYARPESGGLLLCACDESVVAPDACDVDPDQAERVAAMVARQLPDFAEARAASLWCGMRTFSEDHGFVIGRDPDVEGLAWVAGLGGHGMTTAPAVGRLAADALLGTADDPLLTAFRPGR